MPSSNPIDLDVDFSNVLPTRQQIKREKRAVLVPDVSNEGHFFLLWSSTTSGNLQTCPRLTYYKTVLRRESNKNRSALSYGQAIHKALELRYRYGQSDVVYQRQIEVLTEHFVNNPVDTMEWRNLDTALECLLRYNKTYEHDPIKSVQMDGEALVEVPFSIPFITIEVGATIQIDGQDVFVKKITVLVRGLIDVIALVDDSGLWIVDHKTTSMGGPGFFNEFRLSAQMILYVWVVKQLYNLKASGALINCIICRKPTIKGSGKPFEFARERYVYTDDHIEEWVEDLSSKLHNYVNRLVNNDWDKFDKSCQSKYGPCEYFDVCTLPRDQRHMVLLGDDFRDVTAMSNTIEPVKEES